MAEQDFDKLLREKLQDYEAPAPASGWEKIRPHLPSGTNQHWLYLGLLLFFLGSMAGGAYVAGTWPFPPLSMGESERAVEHEITKNEGTTSNTPERPAASDEVPSSSDRTTHTGLAETKVRPPLQEASVDKAVSGNAALSKPMLQKDSPEGVKEINSADREALPANSSSNAPEGSRAAAFPAYEPQDIPSKEAAIQASAVVPAETALERRAGSATARSGHIRGAVDSYGLHTSTIWHPIPNRNMERIPALAHPESQEASESMLERVARYSVLGIELSPQLYYYRFLPDGGDEQYFRQIDGGGTFAPERLGWQVQAFAEAPLSRRWRLQLGAGWHAIRHAYSYTFTGLPAEVVQEGEGNKVSFSPRYEEERGMQDITSQYIGLMTGISFQLAEIKEVSHSALFRFEYLQNLGSSGGEGQFTPGNRVFVEGSYRWTYQPFRSPWMLDVGPVFRFEITDLDLAQGLGARSYSTGLRIGLRYDRK